MQSSQKNNQPKRTGKKAGAYSIGDHLDNKPESIRMLFNRMKDAMEELDAAFEVNVTKGYIGFVKNGKNIVQLVIQNKKIVAQLLRVKPGDIDDPEQRMKYVPHSMSDFSKHISEVGISNELDVEYVMVLIYKIYDKLRSTMNW